MASQYSLPLCPSSVSFLSSSPHALLLCRPLPRPGSFLCSILERPCLSHFTPRPVSSASLPQSRRVLATPDDNSPTNQSGPSIGDDRGLSDKKTEAKDAVKKGQATAIVTGAIAVILGVGYLILVQILDSRGVNLVPPPPEAFEL